MQIRLIIYPPQCFDLSLTRRMAWGRPSDPNMTSAGTPYGPSATRNTTPMSTGSSSRATKPSSDWGFAVPRPTGLTVRDRPGRATADLTAGVDSSVVSDASGVGSTMLLGAGTTAVTW